MKQRVCGILYAILILIIACLASCNKNSSSQGNITPIDTTTTITDTIPSNIVDIQGSQTAGIGLTPYPGIPSFTNLISESGLGYYYISIGGGDTIAFIIQADSTGGSGSNAAISGQTSSSGPNYYASGDSLEFLVTPVQYNGQFGGTGTAYFANDLTYASSMPAADSLNFSLSYGTTQIYLGSISTNNTYNLLNKQAFIAFRLSNSSGYRYGWMSVSSDLSSGNLLTVFEIAYNKNYNGPITIGEYK